MMTPVDNEILPTRESLLSRLKDLDDHASWKEFFDAYWRLIYNTAIKFGLNDSEAQEVVQETVISVCRNVGDFKYDPRKGSFKTWLFNLTRWRVLDQLRKRQNNVVSTEGNADASEGEGAPTDLPAAPQADQYWQEEWDRNTLHAALQRAKTRVDPKHYQVFDLYALQELSPSEVARMMSISVAKVYLVKHRVGRVVREELRRLSRDEGPAFS